MKKTGNSYILDTNIIIDFFSNKIKLLEKHSNAQFVIPSIVIGELYYGAYLSAKSKLRVKQIEDFIAECEVVVIDENTSKYYGKIKAQLKLDGKPIPENDVWIASLAIQHNLTLITRDMHFKKLKRYV